MIDETAEVKAINGIIIDEIFLINHSQIKQMYSNQVLGIVAEANSKNIPVIIRCMSKQNEIDRASWLKKQKVEAIAADKKTFNNTLFGFKLNSSDCLHISHEKSLLYKKTAENVEYMLIDSSTSFDRLLTRLQQQKFKKRSKDANFEVSLLSDSDSFSHPISTSQDGDLGETKTREEFSSCRSAQICGFFGGAGVGFITGGIAEYFIWPFVKGFVPVGAAAEISIKLAFAFMVAGMGSGMGYGISRINWTTQSEAETEPRHKRIV